MGRNINIAKACSSSKKRRSSSKYKVKFPFPAKRRLTSFNFEQSWYDKKENVWNAEEEVPVVKKSFFLRKI